MQCSIAANKRVYLFLPSGLQQRWASRITERLSVAGSRNDGLPSSMFEKCKQYINSTSSPYLSPRLMFCPVTSTAQQIDNSYDYIMAQCKSHYHGYNKVI